MTSQQRNILAGIVLVVAVLALAAGVVYLTVRAPSLPSFMGQLHDYSGHRSKRGVAALVVGGVLLVIGAGLLLYRPRPQT